MLYDITLGPILQPCVQEAAAVDAGHRDQCCVSLSQGLRIVTARSELLKERRHSLLAADATPPKRASQTGFSTTTPVPPAPPINHPHLTKGCRERPRNLACLSALKLISVRRPAACDVKLLERGNHVGSGRKSDGRWCGKNLRGQDPCGSGRERACFSNNGAQLRTQNKDESSITSKISCDRRTYALSRPHSGSKVTVVITGNLLFNFCLPISSSWD